METIKTRGRNTTGSVFQRSPLLLSDIIGWQKRPISVLSGRLVSIIAAIRCLVAWSRSLSRCRVFCLYGRALKSDQIFLGFFCLLRLRASIPCLTTSSFVCSCFPPLICRLWPCNRAHVGRARRPAVTGSDVCSWLWNCLLVTDRHGNKCVHKLNLGLLKRSRNI